MNIDNSMKLFFDYRYLVYEIVSEYNPERFNIEALTDAGICKLLKLAQEYNSDSGHDFKALAIFHIKSEINKRIQNED